MGKKGLKKQPKQPNAANYGDPATAQGITPSLITSITTNQPTSTSQVDSHAPATTRISFFDFITLATTKDIKEFLKLASTTPEGENLGYLWRRAHGEGYEKGRKSLLQDLNKKMEDKFEERGMDLGREEGYTIAKEAFDDIINTVKAREATKKAITTNSGTQTVSTTTITSIATQTSPLTTPTLYDMSPSPLNIATSSKITKNAIITSTVDVSTQMNHLEAKSSTTSDSFAQTNCFNTKKSCQLIQFPSSVIATPRDSTATTGTQIEYAMSQDLEMGYSACVATTESPALLGNAENAKIGTTKATTNEISQNFDYFPFQTLSTTSLDCTVPSTIFAPHELCSKLAGFVQNHQEIEKSPIFTQNPPISLPPSILEPANDVTRVYASQTAPNKAVLRPSRHSTSASSAEDPQPPAVTIHPKSDQLQADFKSQPSTESSAPTCIVTGLKTRSDLAGFTENSQKIEKTPIFPQKTPESLISTRFSWSDDAVELPIVSKGPTKHPRDLSGLCFSSSSKNPFLSLQCCRQNFNKSRPHFFYSKPRYQCHHTFSNSYSHSQNPYHHSKPPFSASLDWNQDPRLTDLSNALYALGWVRR